MIFLSMARKELKLLLRDRLSTGILLGMPVALMVVLGLLLGEGFGEKADETLRVSIVDLDKGLIGLEPGTGKGPQAASVAGHLMSSPGSGALGAVSLLQSGVLEEKSFPHQPWSKVMLQDLRETAGIRIEIIPTLEEAERLIEERKRAAIIVFEPDFSRKVSESSFLAEGVNPFYRDGVLLDKIGVRLLKDERQAVASSIISQVLQVTLLRVILPYMIGNAFERLSDPSFIERLGDEVTVFGVKLNQVLRNDENRRAVGRGIQRSLAAQFPRYNLTGKTWASLTKSKSRVDFGMAATVGMGASPTGLIAAPLAYDEVRQSFEHQEQAAALMYQNRDGLGFLHRGAARYQLLVPACTVMFAFALVLPVGWLFVLERRQGTLKRLRMAPISRGDILAGKFLPSYGLSVGQGIFLLLIGHFVLGMQLGPEEWSWGRRGLALLPVVLTTSFAAMGLALLIATLAKTEIQVALIGSLVVLLLALLSGCLIPPELLPEEMREISRWTPHAWSLDAYRELLAKSVTGEALEPSMEIVLRSCLVLVAFGTGLLATAWAMIRLK